MKKRLLCILLLCMVAIFTGCDGSEEETPAPKIKARQGEIGEALETLAVTTPNMETDFETEALTETSIAGETETILIPEETRINILIPEEQEQISTEESENLNPDEENLGESGEVEDSDIAENNVF